MEGVRTRGLAVVTEMDEEDTSDTTGRQAEVSGDKVNDRRTYGAAIEVPEMVLVEVVESIQAEVTSTPRNQTGKNQDRRQFGLERGDAPSSDGPKLEESALTLLESIDPGVFTLAL